MLCGRSATCRGRGAGKLRLAGCCNPRNQSAPPPPPRAPDEGMLPRACRKCGVEEGGTVRLLICGKCKTLKLTDPAYYCSRECQRADWPEHQMWHMGQDALAAGNDITVGGADGIARRVAEWRTEEANATCEYDLLVARGQQHISRMNWKKAAEQFEKAIVLEPDRPEAHASLALTYQNASDARTAREYLAAMSGVEPGTPDWAHFAVSALTTNEGLGCGAFCTGTCCADLPAWLHVPAEMKQVVDRIQSMMSQAHPHRHVVTQMQATALDGLGQFEAAGRAYTQAAQEACAMGGVMDGHTWPSKEAADFMQAMMKGTKEILLEKARAAFAKAGQGSASTEPDGDIVAATLVAHMARIMSGDSRPVTMLHYQ